jgi:hypothetical protein
MNPCLFEQAAKVEFEPAGISMNEFRLSDVSRCDETMIYVNTACFAKRRRRLRIRKQWYTVTTRWLMKDTGLLALFVLLYVLAAVLLPYEVSAQIAPESRALAYLTLELRDDAESNFPEGVHNGPAPQSNLYFTVIADHTVESYVAVRTQFRNRQRYGTHGRSQSAY